MRREAWPAVGRYNRIVITREEWDERQRQWAEFHRWERTQPPVEYAPGDAIAALGTILEWIPPSIRAEERDPERRGVQRMHALLRLLSAR